MLVSTSPGRGGLSWVVLCLILIEQSTGPRFMGIKTQRRATKAAYAQRLELIEDDFSAKLFKYGAELDSLMVNDAAVEEEEEKPQQRGKGGKGGRKNA